MNAVLLPWIDRTQYIGSSDASAIMNVSPWKTEYMLYQEKIGAYVEEITPEKQRIFDRGHRWEPIVVDMLMDELHDRGHEAEIICRNRRYIDSEHSFLATEVDLEIMLDGEHTNCEMKTVHPFAAKDWGQEHTDQIPMYYTAQVLHAQMVTKRKRTIVAALIGADDLRVHVVYRDDEIIDLMRAKEIAFWHRVQYRNPPEIKELKDIKQIYARDQGSKLEASDELYRKIMVLKATRDEIRDMEKKALDLEAEIKKAVGDHALLEYNGTTVLTWKNNKESVKTQWKEAFDYLALKNGLGDTTILEAIKTHSKTVEGARVFKIK